MKSYTLHPPFFFLLLLFCMASCKQKAALGSAEHIQQVTENVTDELLVNTNAQKGDWLTHGLNYSEDRYSPLDQINKENVKTLGLAWTINLGSKRGIETTPLVVDGIMFLTGVWSTVFAIDTRKGTQIWSYDPQVPKGYGEKACCDVVNRGVALYKGKVYVGTLDGRLIALDAATGKPIWTVMTVDSTKPYTITGAPRVVQGKVIIGNGGAEYGVRGYITAYDAESGKEAWRFYTVPGDPSKPFESKAMEAAAKTWTGKWWEYGGGGTAWDAMAYDPELKLLYVGTGNGSPWDRKYRSPEGGDNLYLSSILAINPDNGELVWHYQTTPGDSWDFTATQHIILADLNIGGQKRKVLMQAPKNGFFYVIDRTNGKFISADAFVYVSWAKGVDQQTGRPIETDFAHYETVNTDLSPIYSGGHNWQAMAYNPITNLVYIPARDNVTIYGHDPNWQYNKKGFGAGNGWNIGIGYNPSVPVRSDTFANKNFPRGMLIAWNPVERKEVWRVNQKADWNGGVVTTAAGLVFQGDGEGRFIAFDGSTGKNLWQTNVGGGVIAPPVTYMVDGKQYVTIAVGWGGGFGGKQKFAPLQTGTVFTFVLGGNQPNPPFAKAIVKTIPDIKFTASGAEIAHGGELFAGYCMTCHALAEGGGGIIPDLAYASETTHQNFMQIVQKGAYLPLGMPNFGNRLSETEVSDIQKFILYKAKMERDKK